MSPKPSFVLAGASPDTGNLGVSALCYAALDAILARRDDATISVLSHTRDREALVIDERHPRAVTMREARDTRRIHQPSSLLAADIASRLRVVPHPLRALFRSADAVLDISGGDSFSDIYGPRRFRAICATKMLAIREGAPLILLPQTFGPFRAPGARARAATIVRAARACWARDARSFQVLRELLADRFDPARHRVGVDVAFALPRRKTASAVDTVSRARSSAGSGSPTVGVNISGLLVNYPDAARERYGFRADYTAIKTKLTQRLAHAGAAVVLVPHVITPTGHYESDSDACHTVRDEVVRRDPAFADRVSIAPAYDDPREVKWLIAQLDWFCGTRMHSTIASLSSGVPTGAVSYSPKTLGVFESCAQGEHVADPTTLDTDGVVEAMWRSFERRDTARSSLAAALPGVLAQAEAQMDDIVSVALGARPGDASPPEPGRRVATTGVPAA